MRLDIITNKDLIEVGGLQPDGWPDVVDDFSFYVKSSFCTPLKANIKNRLVGVGCLIRLGTTAWLAHIIVDSDLRKQGIGTRIVKELLAYGKNNSIKTHSLVATELGRHVYERVGFKEVAGYTCLKRKKSRVSNPQEKYVISFHEKYRSNIYNLDAEISGEDRKLLLNQYLSTSLLYVKGGEVLGYFLPRLKEGPIYAIDQEAGKALMKSKHTKSNIAILPSDNHVGISFLKEEGFDQVDWKGIRMSLGEGVSWRPNNIYSRIGGNLG